jgi:YVTN family beta-propeller protein
LIIQHFLMRRHLLALTLTAAVLLLAGCGNSTDPGPGKPTTITISAGDGQSGGVGTQLAAPIAVKISDDKGRGVPGVIVDFLVTAGGGQLSASSAPSNAGGIATTRWTLGTDISASQTVMAQLIDPSTGSLVASVVFHATPTAGPAAHIGAISGFGQSAFENTALAAPITVLVTDNYSNPVSGVSVSFTVPSGGGSVSPATSTTNANGRASTTWTIGSYGAPQIMTATVTAVGSVSFSAGVLRQQAGTSVALSARPFGIAVSPTDVVYVTQLDASSVTRYNGTSTAVAATIGVGSIPTDVTFDPSGTRAYTADQFSQRVSIINVGTNAVVGTIPVTGDPFRVLVSPDAAYLYVITNANTVYKIDLSTKAVVGQISFSATPNGLALTPDGSTLYVGTRAGGTVVEVTTANMSAGRTFFPGGTIQEVRLSPDGTELYTVNEEGLFFVYSLGSGALASSLSLGASSGAFGATITPSPDRTKLFVTLMWTGEVKVIDRGTRAVTRTIYVGGTPRRIAFTSDGTAVIANEMGYVTWVK